MNPALLALLVIVGEFVLLWLVLSALDWIARSRGLPGAHPLSPAVAWALVAWMLQFSVVVVALHANMFPAPALSASQGQKNET